MVARPGPSRCPRTRWWPCGRFLASWSACGASPVNSSTSWLRVTSSGGNIRRLNSTWPQPLATVQVHAEEDVLQRRHVLEERGELEGAHQPALDDLMRLKPVMSSPPKTDGAGRRPQEAGQQIEAGRLAGAVRADEADDLALVDGEVDVVDGGESAEVLGEVTRFEKEPASHVGRGSGFRRGAVRHRVPPASRAT